MFNEIVEKRLKFIEEIKQKEKEKEEQRIQEEKDIYNIEFCLTYYGRSKSENGGHNCTAYQTQLREGICANNVYPKGTIIKFENGIEYIVEDKGGSSFNSHNRLDIFVDTYSQTYLNKLGKKYVNGKVILPK